MPDNFKIDMIQFWRSLANQSLFQTWYLNDTNNNVEHLHTQFITKMKKQSTLNRNVCTYIRIYSLYVHKFMQDNFDSK